jgi:anti-sigma B factor antagonist
VSVEVGRRAEGSVVRVCGEVDPATSALVWQGIEEAIDLGGPLVIDLTETTFMDSSGMTLLVRARQRLGEGADEVVVRGPSPAVRAVLDLTGIDTIVRIEEAGHGTDRRTSG